MHVKVSYSGVTGGRRVVNALLFNAREPAARPPVDGACCFMDDMAPVRGSARQAVPRRKTHRRGHGDAIPTLKRDPHPARNPTWTAGNQHLI